MTDLVDGAASTETDWVISACISRANPVEPEQHTLVAECSRLYDPSR